MILLRLCRMKLAEICLKLTNCMLLTSQDDTAFLINAK